MNKRVLLIGLSVGIWVSIYAVIQTLVSTLLGIGSMEIWPVLMAPGLVGLLGGGKPGMIKYYKTGATGILAGFLFVVCEHALVPHIGQLGILLPLTIMIALIVCLGKVWPDWFGAVTFVTFNASTILTDGILLLTVSRLLILLVGGTLFLLVESKLIQLISAAKLGREETKKTKE